MTTKYSEQWYSHTQDQRTNKEKEEQRQVVEKIVHHNIESLKIQMTSKKKISYQSSVRERVELGEEWYCFITDNKLKKKHTILTLHGAPGDHVQWAGLQTEVGTGYRWINLTFPGFDGQDERRGNYNGSMDHFSQLILRLLKRLNIKKVILCTHSMGSIYCSYFITKYPQVVEGYLNITGIVDHWYTGLLTFFRISIAQYGYNSQEWKSKKLFDDDKSRAIMHNLFLKEAETKRFGPVPFPKLTKTQYFAYMKLFNSAPNGLSQLYNLNRNLNILRVLIFGKKDPLHQWPLTQASIYHLCRGQQSYINSSKHQKILSLSKSTIQKRLKDEFNITINADKLQEYFCFHLDDTGHNAHRRRPKEISRIIKIYTVCLEVMEEYSQILKSKL